MLDLTILQDSAFGESFILNLDVLPTEAQTKITLSTVGLSAARRHSNLPACNGACYVYCMYLQVVGNVSEPTPVNEPESEQPHHSGSSTVPSESTQLTPVKV